MLNSMIRLSYVVFIADSILHIRSSRGFIKQIKNWKMFRIAKSIESYKLCNGFIKY